MGDTGPCGPCSEIFVDLEPDRPEVGWEEGTEGGRYLEIWNLVFMQFDRGADGALVPLPKPSVDTGAGLERVSAVLQGVGSNYDTDLFQPILAATAALAGTAYGGGGESGAEADVAMRVIADHLRALAFLLADGVIAGNEGRGYVLRRLLRRAVRHGMRLGFDRPFLHRLLPVVGEVLGDVYPELGATRDASAATIEAEEAKFLATLAGGARQVQEEIEAARRAGKPVLDGPVVFRLYDTHGLPLEVIREIAEEERMGIDEPGFEAALEAQRERSREAGGGDAQKQLAGLGKALGLDGSPTLFDGYRQLLLDDARVQRLARFTAGGARLATELAAGEEGVAVLDRTIFYAESGGQVGDRGTMAWEGGRAEVTDTQKDAAGTTFHLVTVREGALRPGLEVRLEVDPALRLPTQRNHTATHLLHAALREVLGRGVRQAGSLVAPDRLRFDFTHSRPLTADELRRVEERVNEEVLKATPTVITADRPRADALAAGAMALFGEKYGDRVRTVEVPGVSLELCGGCHVANTGEIGPFVVTSERGIASGVRRIEALTGEGALRHLRRRDELLAGIEDRLGVPAERAGETVDDLRRELKERDEALAKLRLELVAGAGRRRRAQAAASAWSTASRCSPARCRRRPPTSCATWPTPCAASSAPASSSSARGRTARSPSSPPSPPTSPAASRPATWSRSSPPSSAAAAAAVPTSRRPAANTRTASTTSSPPSTAPCATSFLPSRQPVRARRPEEPSSLDKGSFQELPLVRCVASASRS